MVKTYKMEPDAVNADDDLQNVPSIVLENIICELNEKDDWLKVAENLVDGNGQRAVSYRSVSQMKRAASPAREVIHILIKNNLKVYHLQDILEGCQLYNILRLINTNDPAKILVPEKDERQSVTLDHKVSLAVEVRGSPYPDMQWYFESNPIIGRTSPILTMEKFSIQDVGEYTCKIRQKLNGAVSEVTSHKYILKAEDKAPKVMNDLKDVEVQSYEDVILSFEVDGYPKPQHFSWYKNGGLISETKIPHLIIGAVDVHNSGEYYCVFSSRSGSCTTRRALVKVQKPILCPEKPKIIEQPKANQEYYVGDRIDLTCEALCRKPVKFTCFLNNEELAGSSGVHDITTSGSKYQYRCYLKYHLTKEQMDEESWKPFVFKFAVSSQNSHAFSDDVTVKVYKRDIEESYKARNKWALLIGNSDYRQQGNLPASKNDIKIMQKNFEKLGFRVLMLTNLKRNEIRNAVKLLSTFIQKGDYVSFFYAGHGIQSDGTDYIIPLDASLKRVSRMHNVPSDECEDISIDECISYLSITNEMQRSEPALLFSVYDTCRMMKPKYDGCQSNSSQDSFLYALKNSYFIFATSENYEAYESSESNTSLLVNTLQKFMTLKIPVKDLSAKVLENFNFPSECDGSREPQVPKISADLALPLSLADPSCPQESDKSEFGVLQKWERLGGVGGTIQDYIQVADAQVKASVCWNAEPHRDGVRWVISNCLLMTVSLSQVHHPYIQEMDVQITLSTGQKDSRKLKQDLCLQFFVSCLQEFEPSLVIKLDFTYKGQLYKKDIHLESPAISQQFIKGNYIG